MIFFRLLMQTVALAVGQINANKFRSILTALGIIIGVSSVTAVIAAMTGMRDNVLQQFEQLGANKMWIWGEVPREQRGKLQWQKVQVTLAEADALAEHCPSIDKITPLTNMAYPVSHGEISLTNVQCTGIRPAWHDIENRYTTLGRTFTSIDDEGRRQVCLINEKAIEELRLDKDPVGDYILVNNHRFLIVGVLETNKVGPMFGGGESRSEIFMPFGTAEKLNRWRWVYLIASITDPKKAADAKQEARFVLRTMRGLKPESPDTFGIQALQTFIDSFNAVAAGITLVVGGVVSVSLLVGGVGIMNIMLVSVSERTREIGLRKAIGARPAVILLQFLTEAIVLCLAGGLIGVVLGQVMTLVLQNMESMNLEHAQIPLWAFALAFGFSAGVGVIFGMFPAIKAARLDPIEALRHE